MKNRILFYLLCLLLPINQTLSQITITAGDMPEVDDVIVRSITANDQGYDFEQTGEDHTWEYTLLESQLQQVDTFVSIASTPPLYQLVFFYPFVATIALPGADFDLIPGFELNDVYQFYKETNDFYGQAGYAATFAEIPLPVKYDDHDVLYEFPLGYSETYSSQSEFSMGLPGLGYFSTSRSRENEVDGWGTLITPYGSFETLRVRSEVAQSDSIYIDSLGIGFPINRTYTEYKWLANGYGIPLLSVTKEGLITTISYIDTLLVSNNKDFYSFKRGNIRVFPNPSYDHFRYLLNIPYTGCYTVELIDMKGSSHYFEKRYNDSQFRIEGSVSLKQGREMEGLYLLRVNTGNNIYSAKVCVR